MRICPYIPAATHRRAAAARRNPRARSRSQRHRPGGHVMSLPVSPPGLDLFSLLPAVYRMRDMQLAQSLPLLTADEQATLAQLQAAHRPGGMPPLAADQQALLDELDAKASRGPLQSLLLVIQEQVAIVGQRPRPALRRPVHRDLRALGDPLHRRPDRLPGGQRHQRRPSTIRAPRSPTRSRSAAARAPCW